MTAQAVPKVEAVRQARREGKEVDDTLDREATALLKQVSAKRLEFAWIENMLWSELKFDFCDPEADYQVGFGIRDGYLFVLQDPNKKRCMGCVIVIGGGE